MTKASDNVFPRFLISEGGSTATPAAGRVTLYAKADGLLYSKDDAGTESAVSGGSGNTLSSTLVRRTTAQNVSGSGTETDISWDTETEDISGVWAIGTPTKLVIPAGLNGRRAVVYGGAIFTASTTGNYRHLRIRKAGSAMTPDVVFIIPDLATAVSTALQLVTPPLTLTTADEFTMVMRIDGTGIGIDSGYFGLYTVD